VKSNLKVVITSHFTISFEHWFVGALEVLFPLDFHQLILGDSVDDSWCRLDQVGAKPELFNFILSFLNSEHVFWFF